MKKISILLMLLVGATNLMAQSVTHAEELKKEALNFSTNIVKLDRSGDASIEVKENQLGTKTIKVTKKDAKIVRVGIAEKKNNELHILVFFYKNDKLIMSSYTAVDQATEKKTSNFRYYNKKGKCESSVLQDGIHSNGEVNEVTGDNKETKTRKSEADKLFKAVASGDLSTVEKMSFMLF